MERIGSKIRTAGADFRDNAAPHRALADDLWILLPELSFESLRERARFHHNAAVFYGSHGPGADLGRARDLFRQTLEHFVAHEEDGWRARALHNLATAIANKPILTPARRNAGRRSSLSSTHNATVRGARAA